jgi:hypothetical protein
MQIARGQGVDLWCRNWPNPKQESSVYKYPTRVCRVAALLEVFAELHPGSVYALYLFNASK